jgi:hypothetical protein
MSSLEDLSFEQRDELALLVKKMSDDPKIRPKFLGLVREINPDMPIPELDIEAKTNNAVLRAEQRVNELENKLREKDAVQDLEARRNRLIKRGLSEQDIPEVEKIMIDKGITNHEAAADYWEWMRQAATPTSATGGYQPNPLAKFNLKPFWKNHVTAARDEASRALTDLRKGNVRPIGF